MKRLIDWAIRSYQKKIDGRGLALFRIFYGIILWMEVQELYSFNAYFFDVVPFQVLAEQNFTFILLVWMLMIACLIVGLFTRFAALVSCCYTLVFFSQFKNYEYHWDHVMSMVNFLLIFLPVSNRFSLDSLLAKLFAKKPLPEKVPALMYLFVSFCTLGLLYFDSFFQKISSKIWLNGLAIWLPASYPNLTWMDLSFILNIKFLMLFLAYLTLAFELVFIFLFWFKKWRIPLVIVGVGLHIGILLSFPIPWFSLGMLSLYFLVIPVGIYQKIGVRLQKKSPSATVYYRSDNFYSESYVKILQHFDIFSTLQFIPKINGVLFALSVKEKESFGVNAMVDVWKKMGAWNPMSALFGFPFLSFFWKKLFALIRKKGVLTDDFTVNKTTNIDDSFALFPAVSWQDITIRLWVAFFMYCAVMQGFQIYLKSESSVYVHEKVLGENHLLSKVRKRIYDRYEHIFFFFNYSIGITPHDVFLDKHFETENPILAVVYKPNDGTAEKWLPIICQNGFPDYYNYGRRWAYWTFRVNNSELGNTERTEGLKRITAFWAEKNGISLEDAVFQLKIKKTALPPRSWEYDFLHKQMAKPWIDAGTVEWKSRQFMANIPAIKTL